MTSKTIPILLAFGLVAGPALAAQTRMTCENPRRSYVATFDDEANTFRVGSAGPDTFYQVERVQNDGNGQVVRGKTVKDGPDFAAYLGAKKRIEFIDGGEVIQTDPCK